MDGEGAAARQAAGRAGRQLERLAAIKTAWPGTVIERDSSGAKPVMIRGQLSPDWPRTRWALQLAQVIADLEAMAAEAASR